MDKPQRKLSRNSSRSLWHRKSAKKSTAPSATPPSKHLHLNSSQSLVTMDSKANDTSDEEPDHSPFPPPMSRSIIPDPLNELPTWYSKESELAAANFSTFRIKYPLHNPIGPKSYRNHHLIPPASLNPNNRPPSVFSPSFPPMAPSLVDRSQDSSRLPPPSRTPSATTLQTPSSSQVRIPDLASKPRSRKTSQDNADLLDASDPWGTHWHHQSPYDTGSNISPVSVDSPDASVFSFHSSTLTQFRQQRSRSRLSSMNTVPTRHKTVIPSPLSQSTSALNPQPPEPTVTRKLSKQRKPVFANLFGGHDKGTDSTTSNSAAPQRASTIAGSSLQVPDTSARRNSTSVPPSASTTALSTHSSTKKERRTSVLGRLVRKFSILKKSTQEPGPTISEQVDSELQEGASSSDARRSFVSQRQPSPEKPSLEKKHSDPSRRVPPPRIDSDLMTRMTNGRGPSAELEREIPDHRSSISYEIPFSPGKLTITNPDTPSSGATSPIRISIALPSEDSAVPQPESKPHTVDTPQLRPVQSRQEHSASREPRSPGSPQSHGKTSPVKRVSPVPASSSPPSVVRSPASQPFAQSPPFLPTLAPVSKTTPASFTSAPATTEIRMIHAYSIATSAIASTSDDSPLSKASLLVNPPTPYDYDTNELHPDLSNDVPKVVQIEKVPGKASSRETSPVKRGDGEVVRVAKSNSTTSRKTETFRLMRNPSDKVSSSGETITVEGEHWTVVNSSDAPRRRRTKEKVEKNERVEKPSSSTRDRESRREQRRLDKAAQEAAENHQRAISQSRTKQGKADAGDPASERTPRSRSFDTSPRMSVVQPMTVFTIHGEPSRHRKSDDRPRDSQYQQSHSRPTRPSHASGIAHVERLPSTTTRPTSEMTSAADINALRAREAWEMDRLWKGRSMYYGHPEANVIASPSSTRDSRHVNGEFIVDVPGHGSSHTSYLVQPLQAHPMPASVFYANMPSAPPPIIYTAASPYDQVLHQGGNQPSDRSLANSFAFPSTENPADRPNPLPRPPRQSSYQPAHLPVLSDRGSAAVSDYWTNNKYPPVPSH